MQILHFDWLRYYRSISNSHRVVKFTSFVNLYYSIFTLFPNKFFFAEFIIAFFCRTCWVILKQSDPSPSNATDFRATGLIIILLLFIIKQPQHLALKYIRVYDCPLITIMG